MDLDFLIDLFIFCEKSEICSAGEFYFFPSQECLNLSCRHQFAAHCSSLKLKTLELQLSCIKSPRAAVAQYFVFCTSI